MSGSVTGYSTGFRRCLETLDVELMRKLWKHVRPNLPQPETAEDTLISIHMARTQANTIDVKLRGYSHAWLLERGLPSQLPDHLRASAERMYPRVVRAVGISVNARSPLLAAVVVPVREAMENAVNEAFADNASDDIVSRHMADARSRTLRKLLG